jgi:hypothetical protein
MSGDESCFISCGVMGEQLVDVEMVAKKQGLRWVEKAPDAICTLSDAITTL